ncbi:hypothetical protein GQ457_HM001100 [Hibiscus cannabinus]
MDDPSQFLQAFMIPESLLYIIAMVPGDPSSSHGFEFPLVTVIAFGCVVLELYLLGWFGIPFLSVGSVHKSFPVFLFLIYLCRVVARFEKSNLQCLGAPDQIVVLWLWQMAVALSYAIKTIFILVGFFSPCFPSVLRL